MISKYLFIIISLICCENIFLIKLGGIESAFANFRDIKDTIYYNLLLSLILSISGFLSLSVYSVFLINIKFILPIITVIISLIIIYLTKFIFKYNNKNLYNYYFKCIPMLSINCINVIVLQIISNYNMNYISGLLTIVLAVVGSFVANLIIISIKNKIDNKSPALLILTIAFASMGFMGFAGIGL